jgi:signal transduction histidine kinase
MPRWRRLDWLYFDLPLARPGSLNAYLIAILVTGLATVLRLALDPWVSGVQFITYFPALILVALLCGAGAGLLSALLCGIAGWYFVVEPRRSFALERVEDAVSLALFFATALMIVGIVAAMRVAIGRYRHLALTLRKRAERQTEELNSAQASLVQAQKMEAVGQLTGGIAHDFNNMLAIVIGNLDIAKRRISQGRADVVRQIENAMEGAQRAAALTRRLLVFARRQPLEPTVCDIARLLGDLTELLRRTLGEKIRIESALARDLWRISVDAAQMESAVINLAINARDAMPGGGTLRIESANVVVHDDQAAPAGLQPGDHVLVTVRDSGIGMSPEVAARAIEPFFTTKEVGRGTGLGLSQVYGFIRQSGGHIEIDSEEGAGTAVRLYLPRHEGAQSAEAEQSEGEAGSTPHGSPGEVVLVVEDEDQVRRTTIEALVELGYGVREARSGVEALAILANDPSVGLLFTDIVMPGLDGRQLAERALRQRPDLKILYTTGYTPEGGPSASLPDDYPALLQKPFSVDRLARKVREMLDD